jgi:hypothetical protein
LGLTPKEWGDMTLGEFSDAVDGFNELESERLRWTLYNTRKICYYAIRPHLDKGSELKEEDLISIPELDKEIERARAESLPVVKILQDGGD